MKTLASFSIAALLFLIVGCSENSVNPIAASPTPNPAPVIQKLQLSQAIDITMPEGTSMVANLEGDITYQLAKVDRAFLTKELPVPSKTSYRLILTGQGEVSLFDGAATTSLKKPITWTFSKSMTDIVDEGGDFIVTFPITGTRYQVAHLHLGFVVSNNRLVRDIAYVDFHVDGGE
jgi:hypothetical protein